MAISLRQSIVQSSDCKSFTISDTTGTYNATTRTGGYGSPNFNTDDITAATLTVTLFGETSGETINVYSTLPTTDDEVEFTVENTDLGFSASEKISDGIYLFTYLLTGDFTITGVNTGTKTFTVAGNKSGVFAVGATFTVTGSTGNNATYTVVSSTYTSSTAIVVSETVASAVADGQINFTATTSQYEVFFCNINCCLNDKLNDLDPNDCECNSSKLELASKINTLLLATKYAARCGKANKANALLSYLTTLCNLTNCSSCN